MAEFRMNLTEKWRQERTAAGVVFRYPAKEGARGFYPYGFIRKNDSTADWVGWYGLEAALRGADEREGIHEIGVQIFFADTAPLRQVIRTLFQDGQARLEIPFLSFPLETAKGNYWRFVTAVAFSWEAPGTEIVECAAKRRQGIYLDLPVKGKSGRPGEKILYQGEICNCTSRKLVFQADQIFEGWESMAASVRPAGGVLEAGSSLAFSLEVRISENMTPGSHEDTVIRVRGQGGDLSCQEQAVCKTCRYLPHPYLYHDRDGWKQVWENMETYAFYREAREDYRKAADSWVVTAPMKGYDFCYETKITKSFLSAAYLYAMTGDEKYARKLADFYGRLFDPVAGYPAKKKGCSQSYVQEGHFFQHLAVGLDILCRADIFSPRELARAEESLRLYMDMLDVHIRSGQISNWILSELLGALYCALTLQDMDRALRFVFGPGGIVEQFRRGVFPDGWWFECSVGYNTWVSSMLLHAAHALLPFGYDLTHTLFGIPFNREVCSTYSVGVSDVKSGMYNQKWGEWSRGALRIKDLFDAVIPYVDYRGVIFGIADSDEKKLAGPHFGSSYDLAYRYYQDDRYLHVIANTPPDPIFGDPKVYERALALQKGQACNQERAGTPWTENAYSDNIGLAMLRSRKKGRPEREQIQAVLRYGSHGYAHGHFDITELLSVMRYGRSFFNPEHCWWGYGHFMYKFYVQNSLTKNMVTVDEKMQIPADSRRILWQSEPEFSAVGIQVCTKWAYPPYGGMVYEQDGDTGTKEDLRRRCRKNGCFLPIQEGKDAPAYGELSGFTEDILQKRILVLTDDYLVLFDYLEGEREHQYDSLMQIKGFEEILGESVERTHHTEQMNENPVSDAQFITDCSWYQVKGGSAARFCMVFTGEHAGEQQKCDRSNYNEPGLLRLDVHTAWPEESEQMIGRVAVYDGWAADAGGYTIPLSYRMEADGTVAGEGAFDGWILGKGEAEALVEGVSFVALAVRQGCMYNEIGREVPTPQGVFWGEICLERKDGQILNIGQCLLKKEPEICARVHMENTDVGYGPGRDYRNGRVTIVGKEYPYALGASPVDHGEESRIVIDLRGLGAVKIRACVGVDAFPGDEWQKRKTYAVRSRGRIGRYITVIEPYETEPVVRRVKAEGPDQVCIVKRDGRAERITIHGIQSAKPVVRMDSGRTGEPEPVTG